MAYTDLTSAFAFKNLVTWQLLNALANNDAYLKTLLSAYRRPVLQYNDANTVNGENNTATLNQTTIVFPDGVPLSVTEDLTVTQKYRRFDITKTANFTSGEQSGLLSSLSRAANTWYAIYAVKSQFNTANFVLVGDTTLPLQANISTLNIRYGNNSWYYLGMVRNGDNASATNVILNFQQSGGLTVFMNSAVGNQFTAPGTILATSASATSITYSYSAGIGTTAIPDHIKDIIITAGTSSTGGMTVKDSGSARTYQGLGNTAGNTCLRQTMIAAEGVAVSAASSKLDLLLSGFYDTVLSGTGNPLI